MQEAERDNLIIKRGALLKRKRLLDAIDKLRQHGSSSQKEFQTTLGHLAEVVEIQEWNLLTDLISSINEKDAISIVVDDNDYSGNPWGENYVWITVGNRFGEHATKIRNDYHVVNSKLGEKTDLKKRFLDKMISYTSVVWVIIFFIKLIKPICDFLLKNKVLSAILGIISLIAIDYVLAWSNIRWIAERVQFWIVNFSR